MSFHKTSPGKRLDGYRVRPAPRATSLWTEKLEPIGFSSTQKPEQLSKRLTPMQFQTRIFPDYWSPLGLAIENYFGSEQDIEWCLDSSDQLWVTQSRPITGPSHVDLLQQQDLGGDWSRACDEPFSRLGCDLAIRRHQLWVQARNRYFKTNFKSQGQSTAGFVYYKCPWNSPSRITKSWSRFWRVIRYLCGGRIRIGMRRRFFPSMNDNYGTRREHT